MWLNDSWFRDTGHEIKCVRLRPYRNGDEILVETSVVIPLPEASDYQTRLGQREHEARSESSGKPKTLQGGDAFKASIQRAPEKFRPGLKWLYDEAIRWEGEKIVELFTSISGKDDYYRIQLRVPGTSQYLVSFNNLLWSGKEGGGEISFWPAENYWAPNSLRKIDDLIGEVKSKSGVRHREINRQEIRLERNHGSHRRRLSGSRQLVRWRGHPRAPTAAPKLIRRRSYRSQCKNLSTISEIG